jgi:hypothetical protein
MIQETLEAYGKLGVQLLQGVVPKATGKTAESIRYEVYPNQLVIYARAFFQALETGRGPRRSSEYGGFDNSLLEWMKAKGVGADLNEKKRKQLARFLAYKINKDGDKTFKRGGKDVYSQVVAKFIEELTNEIIKIKTKEYTDKVVAQIKEAV